MRAHTETDHIVAATLRTGAYAAFALMAIGVVAGVFAGKPAEWITRAGLILLLATPVLRIIVALVMFLREGDRRYALVSAGVLLIVLTTSWLAVGLH